MKTTKADFKYFKERCLYWRKRFGLLRWDYAFWHEEYDSGYAGFNYNYEGMTVSISLATKWKNREINKYELDMVAFHENLEMMLADLTRFAKQYFNDAYINENIHKIIRVFENEIFPSVR